MAEHKVIFLPDGIQKNVAEGTTIMAAAAEAGVELEGPCGGRGTCGKCRVLVKARGEEEWVLACKTPVTEDMTIEIPQAAVALHRKSALTETDVHIKIEPGIKKKAIKVKEATVEYQASDTERLLSELGNALKVFNLEALKSLPKAVRKSQGLVTVTMTDDEILAVEPGDVTGRLFGIAVDIGTTTIVVSLVNLLNGETLSTASATNAQNIFGADVIARIEHVMKQAQGLEQLQRRVVNVINRLIEKLSEECSVAPQEIVKVSIAGNTTMGHLFLGLDPSAIAPAPFTPVVRHDVQVEGKQVGLKVYPAAKVTVLPNIAGYVGADTIAVILATNIYQEKGVTLAIDIGTNGEMVLSVNGNLMACSTAAGPAFEGAHIKQGMRAAAGAIEGVRIEEDVMLRVIGNTAAKGICGSGLIDAIAELVRVGIIDQSGKLLGKEEAEHLPDNLRDRLST
ncbi:MAG: ASKHA domain-containing protein, partial [Desulfitobacterium hafniense]|nr:ASKHA domain-containing protein [Desulfitobacterium hafniense]